MDELTPTGLLNEGSLILPAPAPDAAPSAPPAPAAPPRSGSSPVPPSDDTIAMLPNFSLLRSTLVQRVRACNDILKHVAAQAPPSAALPAGEVDASVTVATALAQGRLKRANACVAEVRKCARALAATMDACEGVIRAARGLNMFARLEPWPDSNLVPLVALTRRFNVDSDLRRAMAGAFTVSDRDVLDDDSALKQLLQALNARACAVREWIAREADAMQAITPAANEEYAEFRTHTNAMFDIASEAGMNVPSLLARIAAETNAQAGSPTAATRNGGTSPAAAATAPAAAAAAEVVKPAAVGAAPAAAKPRVTAAVSGRAVAGMKRTRTAAAAAAATAARGGIMRGTLFSPDVVARMSNSATSRPASRKALSSSVGRTRPQDRHDGVAILFSAVPVGAAAAGAAPEEATSAATGKMDFIFPCSASLARHLALSRGQSSRIRSRLLRSVKQGASLTLHGFRINGVAYDGSLKFHDLGDGSSSGIVDEEGNFNVVDDFNVKDNAAHAQPQAYINLGMVMRGWGAAVRTPNASAVSDDDDEEEEAGGGKKARLEPAPARRSARAPVRRRRVMDDDDDDEDEGSEDADSEELVEEEEDGEHDEEGEVEHEEEEEEHEVLAPPRRSSRRGNEEQGQAVTLAEEEDIWA